ncbi:DegT/DnrJ/EryC1/StrS family aminotransferase [Francisella hispaniensis]|uniref:Perosamine synthetase-related protein n=1 Tax=Francisella hispaniensis TaxID=622488 RepID=F4BH53_9GAMM|nr:DegT/DnrJ/EryC1/StrS family aminotransferase [Francisella hispaniensis]AEE26797.1 perosamine synthetase-related protein [Francisella hispaniensis]
MKIDKSAVSPYNFSIPTYYYDSARQAMFDLLYNMKIEGLVDTVLLPGYIGISPKEGSGIFDPIYKLSVEIDYYKMNSNLLIDFDDLKMLTESYEKKKIAVLIVNYFGFIDINIKHIAEYLKQKGCWIIEDNAHGFFTFHNYCNTLNFSDATFFSLHKMLPFSQGGSVMISNQQLRNMKYRGDDLSITKYNPFNYDLKKIANKRVNNYRSLLSEIKKIDYSMYFSLLKPNLGKEVVPQTFPIVIKKGNRDEIYRLMNEKGYGVVSLYHSMIEPLCILKHDAALKLSKSILNLPIHQDVEVKFYKEMIVLLIQCCELTENL